VTHEARGGSGAPETVDLTTLAEPPIVERNVDGTYVPVEYPADLGPITSSWAVEDVTYDLGIDGDCSQLTADAVVGKPR